MATDTFCLTIHMVSSLDGFVAKRDNSVDWFETSDNYEKGVSAAADEDFLKTIDCYLMGSRTYEHAVALSQSYGWVYGNTPTVVVTKRDLPVHRQNIELYSGDVSNMVSDYLKPRYSNVWLVGGPALAKTFIHLNLANEIRLSILPVILGDGLLFFDHIKAEKKLHLKDATAYNSGMVELRYDIRH